MSDRLFDADRVGWAIGRAVYDAARIHLRPKMSAWEQLQVMLSCDTRTWNEEQKRRYLFHVKMLEQAVLMESRLRRDT